MVTPAAWLAGRAPAPDALSRRLREVLGARLSAPTHDLADVFLSAGEGLLSLLLLEGRTSRETALDLLCADALVTYAFEVASDDPARLQARGERAMARISELSVSSAP